MSEKPELWTWDMTSPIPYWRSAQGATSPQVNKYFITVYATIATRDALRDEGLAWAAKAAGLGQEQGNDQTL